jgi:hypothetical protein
MKLDYTVLALGALAGGVACYLLHNKTPAKSYFGLGKDYSVGGYNTSEVWDFRDRVYFSDNLLYNKLPFIQLTKTSDMDPKKYLDFSAAYGPPDSQDPRPRLEHFLDLENRLP